MVVLLIPIMPKFLAITIRGTLTEPPLLPLPVAIAGLTLESEAQAKLKRTSPIYITRSSSTGAWEQLFWLVS
jgi:hypothetical protein